MRLLNDSLVPGWLMVVLLALPSVSSAEETVTTAADVTFRKSVLPIFQQHCLDCHSEDDPELGLMLNSSTATLAGSTTGGILVPGNASRSLLVQVLAKESKPHMPPDGQLSIEEIATISQWIEQLPGDVAVGMRLVEGSDHWAFQPLKAVEIPVLVSDAEASQHTDWVQTPVDQFILSELIRAGLSPNPPAEKQTLIRRVYFDLLGLPPTPEAVAAFVNDNSPDAYERLVDQLLASPHYGERWGRHWLDLARYADSGGFHNDINRPHAWRYRDYVIDSLNADKPYGQFLTEQLAGDLLAESTLETWTATGFCRNGPSNDDNMGKGIAREMYLMDQLDGKIATASNVFLGLTIGCARCHNHKFDPISQRDYYQFLAFFNSSAERQLTIENFSAGKPELVPVNKKPKDDPPRVMVLTDHGQPVKDTHLLWRGDVRNKGPKVAPGFPGVLANTLTQTSLRAEDSHTDTPKLTNRKDLADWLSHPQHPLTWRVMANRLWQHHFGRGIVATPSNFGKLGERPTHPELLDYLANELVRTNGSLKSLHRLILTSAVYRQSSATHPQGEAIDPDNHLLWRKPIRKLEAEPLRDAILAVSGNLNSMMTGSGIKPRIRPELLVASQRNKWPVVKQEGPQHWRRSVYVYVKRQLQLPFLELHNTPATLHSCSRRAKSLVPTQSLVLMNDEFVREQSAAFARRVQREAGENETAQVARALFLALGRSPSVERTQAAVSFLREHRTRLQAEGIPAANLDHEALTDFCQVLINLNEFLYLD